MLSSISTPKYSVLDLGFNSLLAKPSLSLDLATPEMQNVITSGVAPKSVTSGEVISLLNQQLGAIFSGKEDFDNVDAGYRLGIDDDDVAKFYIGNSSSYLNWDGSSLTISGSLTASSGTIAGWTINTAELSSGNVKLQSTAERLLLGSATEPLTGTGIFIGKDGSDYEFRAGNPSGAYMHWTGSGLNITGGVITDLGSGSDLNLQGWQFPSTFYSVDYDTVGWGAATLTFANGVTYSIVAGTVNITTVTYIYFDSAASSTVLQTTTTAATAVGDNKVLIAVANINDDTSKYATFQVFGGAGGSKQLITSQDIAANSITSNEIAANTITASQLSTTLLYAGELTIGSLGHIKGGQTAYDTGNGWFIGYSTDNYKLSIGNSTGDKMTWDGSSLRVKGSIELSSIFNFFNYATASLPIPPSTDGPLNPSAVESSASSAITFDNATYGGYVNGTTLTYSHTTGTGSNRILFVGFAYNSLSDLVTSVTYGGVAMTRINTVAGNFSSYFLYYLLAPATGTNSVVVTISSPFVLISCSSSYSNVKQSGVPDASDTEFSTNTTSLTTTVTSIADNCWMVLFARSASTMSAGAGSTSRAGTAGIKILDNNAAITPAGANDMTVTQAASTNIGTCAATFAPFIPDFTDASNAFSSNNTYATAASSSADISVELSKDGGSTWTNALSNSFTGSDSTLTYGNGQTELWGTAWTGDDVDNTSFRLRITSGVYKHIYKTFGSSVPAASILTGIKVEVEAKYSAPTVSVDHIKVTFYYGTSDIPVQAGSMAYDTDFDSLTFYNGSAWVPTVNTAGAQTIAGVKTFSSDPLIPDEAYGSGWNGSLEPPTKNAVYDKIETIATIFKSGAATKNLADASTTQTIAHGVGSTPKMVKITGVSGDDPATFVAYTVYTNAQVSNFVCSTNDTSAGASGSTFRLGDTNNSNVQSGVVTLDATNITITWTKSGSPSATAYLVWEAFG